MDTEHHVDNRRYTPKPPDTVPDALAAELAVLRTLPQVMQIIRTANTMLAHPVECGSPADEALYMRGLICEARNVLAVLKAGRFERPWVTAEQAPPDL
jgi:hypothetical protein